jgi:hypothetical protein
MLDKMHFAKAVSRSEHKMTVNVDINFVNLLAINLIKDVAKDKQTIISGLSHLHISII